MDRDLSQASLLGHTFLNLRAVSYWLVVAEEQSVTRAARRLSVAQPALSQQVRRLERTLGVDLFERMPSGVRLTAAGVAFLPEAEAMVAAAFRGMRAVTDVAAVRGGFLDVGTYSSLVGGVLVPALAAWRQQYPETVMRVREWRWQELADRVAAGAADFGVGLPSSKWSGPLVDVGWDRFVLIGERREKAGSAALGDLAGRSWISYAPDHGLAELVRLACDREGFSPRVSIESTQVEAAARLAAAGAGLALVPARNVPPDLRPFVTEISPTLEWRLAAFTRTTWSPAASAFLELLCGLTSESRIDPDGDPLVLD